jgi:hypothetical protein
MGKYQTLSFNCRWLEFEVSLELGAWVLEFFAAKLGG